MKKREDMKKNTKLKSRKSNLKKMKNSRMPSFYVDIVRLFLKQTNKNSIIKILINTKKK